MKNHIVKATNFRIFLFVIVVVSGFSGCKKDKISKFISQDTRAYVEVKEENKLRKILTEYNQHYMVMLVFDELNNPEVLKIAFTDASNKQNIWTIQFRQQKEVSLLGERLVEKDYIESLRSSEREFSTWKKRFSSFPVTEPALTQNLIVLNPSNPKSNEIKVLDGENIARIKDMLCFCRNGGIWGGCLASNMRCLFDNLCAAWECIEAGTWTPACADHVERAHLCALQIP